MYGWGRVIGSGGVVGRGNSITPNALSWGHRSATTLEHVLKGPFLDAKIVRQGGLATMWHLPDILLNRRNERHVPRTPAPAPAPPRPARTAPVARPRSAPAPGRARSRPIRRRVRAAPAARPRLAAGAG